MSLIIGAVVIILIIAGAAFFMSGKSNSESAGLKETQNVVKNEKEKVTVKETEREEVKEEKKPVKQYKEEMKDSTDSITKETQPEKKEPKRVEQGDIKEKNKQKEQLYYYINHELQSLFYIYNQDKWDELDTLGEISSILYENKEKIIEELPSLTGRMVEEYFSCIDFKEGEKGNLIGYVKDAQKLKDVFLQFMMPFYPYYYRQLNEGGLRHTALLHPNTLRLFQQLTGKKFRPGYRNRYTTGVRAFEWDKNRYKVYQKDGRLLCDAVFGADGIVDGYGQKKYSDKKHPDWDVVEEGTWKEGVFQGGILRYEYKKTVNL